MSLLCCGNTGRCREDIDNDAEIARLLAQAEQEKADEVLARHLVESEDNDRSLVDRVAPAPSVLRATCGRCGMIIDVSVPPGTLAGSRVVTCCPRCRATNETVIPVNDRPSPTRDRNAQVQRAAGTPYGAHTPSSRPGSRATAALDDRASDQDFQEMIYVACEIGDIAVEMLVDTGAQMSVISEPLVQRLGLRKMLDTRSTGVAVGVGTAQILGKLRRVPVKLGHVEFATDFSVLSLQEPLLILGIDQMRRFQCIVDLERQLIIFGGRGGVEVPFLPPAENRISLRRLSSELGCPQM
eukprot:TRINITY_DN67419_c0_g1_i1.p1 TRINITY_DN67419_c0_g1~~TRINITY_DN67419_c0_g1_i1.p1  ORF type:complete len:297 (+),score=41.09 TRINITY_DN67419_c0_g1_i1:21-911(+)